MMFHNSYAAPLAELIEAFQALPGVGPKTAQRYAFHMLQAPLEQAEGLVNALQQAREHIQECEECHQWTMQSPCPHCCDDQRSASSICVVQSPHDVYAMERTQSFKGKYHVLGGLLSPMEGIGPERLHIRSLTDRFNAALALRATSEELYPTPIEMEAILALPPSTQGEMTGHYIARTLKPLGVKVTRIAYGLPVGGDLDYADQLTLTRSFEGRQLL
jgi:recombination protein RecR